MTDTPATFDADENGAIIALPLLACVGAEIPGSGLIVLRIEFEAEDRTPVAVQLRLPAQTALSVGQMLVSLAEANAPGRKN
jgi:hypothetical protein